MKSLSKNVGLLAVLATLASASVFGNGGPFVIQHPGGDPAAKGVLARIHPDLKPGREERLRVIKEDLTIEFTTDLFGRQSAMPLANVTAVYLIENQTDQEIVMDFGFPILRGIYLNPIAMMPVAQVNVTVNAKRVQTDLISNSAIYGIIRQRARAAIETGIAADAKLEELYKPVRLLATTETITQAREALAKYLTAQKKWNARDASLLVEFASVNLGKPGLYPTDREFRWSIDVEMSKLMSANMGLLAAIGEKKATQLFAYLAGLFDPKEAAGYEAIFAAWGGDVRERAVELSTGKIRPRENSGAAPDKTIYARVDYLDPKNKQLSEVEKASCKTILQNLPVTFTFAPMNLLHYQVKFAPNSTRTVSVAYSQYAYEDTSTPASFQLAYVVHPASLWKDFGPIHLTIKAPETVSARASIAFMKSGSEERTIDFNRMSPVAPVTPYAAPPTSRQVSYAIYTAVVTDKTGELFVGLDAGAWKKHVSVPQPVPAEKVAAPRP